MPDSNGILTITPTSVVATGTGSSASITTNGAVSFTSIDTLAINGIFSSTYDDYMVIYRGTASQETYIQMRLRASGTDNSTASSYAEQRTYFEGTSSGTSRGTDSMATIHYFTSGLQSGFIGYFYGPYLAQQTSIRFSNVGNVAGLSVRDWSWLHSQTTSYDGISLLSYVGRTFSGQIAFYGYRK